MDSVRKIGHSILCCPICDPQVDWKERALEAEAKLESLEMVRSCAQDIVKQWPYVTFRTIGLITKMVETLSQAIELSQK